MSSATAEEKKNQENKSEAIPEYLVYEYLDGQPIYYRGYKEVLNKQKSLEGIMGYSELQSIVLLIIRDYLNDILREEFWVVPGEAGVHLATRNNLATDIAIYPKEAISLKNATNKYFNTPPKVVIEVDTKADPSILEQMDYFNQKTEKLLQFGVEQVVWIYTNTKKVMVAEPNRPWLTVNWHDEIEVMGQRFKISEVLAAAG